MTAVLLVGVTDGLLSVSRHRMKMADRQRPCARRQAVELVFRLGCHVLVAETLAAIRRQWG